MVEKNIIIHYEQLNTGNVYVDVFSMDDFIQVIK